jgi:transposase
VATIAVTRRFDLTDAQWAVLAPLLPVGAAGSTVEMDETAAH